MSSNIVSQSTTSKKSSTSMSFSSSSSYSSSSSSMTKMLSDGTMQHVGGDVKSSFQQSSESAMESLHAVSENGVQKSMQMQQASSRSLIKGSSLAPIDIHSASGSFLQSLSPDITKGLDIEMSKLFTDMDKEMQALRDKMHMSPLSLPGSADEIIKLDADMMKKYVDDVEKDKYKFNFDVHEFQSDSVNVKADGNKIEVSGKKVVSKDGDEQTESYTKVYELPAGVDTEKVTSSIYKDDGVLTVELPVTEVTAEATFQLPNPSK